MYGLIFYIPVIEKAVIPRRLEHVSKTFVLIEIYQNIALFNPAGIKLKSYILIFFPGLFFRNRCGRGVGIFISAKKKMPELFIFET